MIFVVHFPLRAILTSYSIIPQDLRPEVRRNSRMCWGDTKNSSSEIVGRPYKEWDEKQTVGLCSH